jgi:hypothetical protein
MEIIIGILTGLLLVAGFVIWNLLKKVEKQEDLVEGYQQYLTSVDSAIKLSSKRLKEIDVKGMFSSDDEIGWYFSQMKEIQEILDDYKLKM